MKRVLFFAQFFVV